VVASHAYDRTKTARLAKACVAAGILFSHAAFAADEPTAPAAVAEPVAASPTAAGPSLLDQIDSGTPAATPTSTGTNWDVAAAPPAPTYPFVDYHGYFRFRPDLISNGHLGQAAPNASQGNKVLTTSAILPPLSLWPSNNANSQYSAQVGKAAAESMLAGANMRIRFAPTIHLSDTIRIYTTFDIMDNYVMGSNPDYAGALQRPDVPLVAFSTSMRPGVIAVKEAYAEWKTMLGVLRIGRQASNWGLGIFANGGGGDGWDGGRPTEYYGGPRQTWEGSGYDADFASYADRVAFVTKIGPAYIALAYDFASQGLTAIDTTRPDGQARDMEESDDVKQASIAIFSKPMTPAEVEKRKSDLLDDHKSVFDWGAYAMGRWQTNDIVGNTSTSDLTLSDAVKGKSNQLMPRGATAFAWDLWARYEKRIAFSRRLVIEAEWAMLTGHVDDANTLAGSTAKVRDISMFGGALKSAYQNEGIGIYFETGLASGDDTGCFGVYPVAGDASCTLSTADGKSNSSITAFKFHKNFRVDNLLFRDIIGSVTNAVYFKPTFSINAYPFYSPQQLGLDVSVLKALAMTAEGTPGGGSDIGWEFDARGFFGQKGLFLAQVSFAYAITGDAFNLKNGWYGAQVDSSTSVNGVKVIVPENAWRILGHLSLMF
jgi:uncharacterized protein (TIGR04551 family)